MISELKSLAKTPVFQISAVTRLGLDPLLQEVWQILDRMLVTVDG
jgi:GTP-binding protein